MADEGGPACTCKKSECVKRYCGCFESRFYCSRRCSCRGCRNTKANEDEVEEHVEMIKQKKPNAFKRKRDEIVQAPSTNAAGCTCLRSECKKKYCSCLNNEVGCIDNCACQGCDNVYGVKGEPQTDMQQINGIGGSNGTPGGSSGTSNEFPTEANTMGNSVAFQYTWGAAQPMQAFSHYEDILYFGAGNYLPLNVHGQTYQECAQTDEPPQNNANSMQQGPSNLVNNGSHQSNFGRS